MTPAAPRDTLRLTPGLRFGSYRLVRHLGAGGFAEVWEAEREDGTGSVALKILNGDSVADENALERFLQEGRIAARLSHPRTVYVFSAERVAEVSAITMELMRGGSLQDCLDRGETFSPERVIELALDLLDGLEAAHRMGIIHRDIKPSNCLLDEGGKVKLGDFGISRSLMSNIHLTVTGEFIGTPTFAAPELVRGEKADARSDLYSFGATLYALIEGKPPFRGSSIGEVMSRVLMEKPAPPRAGGQAPPALQKLVVRLLDKDPARRPSDYEAIRAELMELSAGSFTPTGPMRRLAAGIADFMVVTTMTMFLQLDEFHVILWGVAVVVCTALEWRMRATPGKLLLGLRISSGDARPSLAQTLVRNLIFQGLAQCNAAAHLVPDGSKASEILSSFPIINLVVLLLFLTMRRANGYRALHDLASGTFVAAPPRRRAAHALIRTPASAVERATVEAGDSAHAYRLMRRLWQTSNGSLVLAMDEVLEREVWVLESGDDAAIHLPPQRPARLRRLRGASGPESSWNAYEKPSGQSILDQVAEAGALPWGAAQPFLVQLLAELEASLHAGDLPQSLSLEQLWMDGFGHLKLLGFPPCAPDSSGVSWSRSDWRAFLAACAALALPAGARDAEVDGAPKEIRKWLQRLSDPNLAPEELAGIRATIEAASPPVPVPRRVRGRQLLVGQSIAIALASVGAIPGATDLLYRDVALHLIALMAVAGIALTVAALVLPSILLAWIFRGGPILRMFGIEVFGANGRAASRRRCALRAALASAPLVLAVAGAMLAGSWKQPADPPRSPAPLDLDFETGAVKNIAVYIGRLPKVTSWVRTPTGWVLSGGRPQHYQAGLDRARARQGRASGFLRSTTARTGDWGTLMQVCQAGDYPGRKIRFSADVMTSTVTESAGLWLRVDRAYGQSIAFDNMMQRPIKGETPWKRYSVVLDVRPEARRIAFGVLLNGKGSVWIDDARIDTVGREVPVTGWSRRPTELDNALHQWFSATNLVGVGRPDDDTLLRRWPLALGGLLMIAGFVLAMLWPGASLPDRVAGTRLMMR